MDAGKFLIAGILGTFLLTASFHPQAFAGDEELLSLIKELQRKIEAQEQRIQKLEAQEPRIQNDELIKDVELLKRQREVDQEIMLKKEKETPIVISSKDGFSLKSKDGDFQIKLKGQIQADGRFYANDGVQATPNTFLIRKARPILEGTAFRYFDFKLMPDFGSNQVQIVDAYIDFKYWKQAVLRAGKFKPPMGLERLQPDAWNLFPELSLASNLLPNRDLGVGIHGELFGGIVNYGFGIFNGSVDNSSNDIDTQDDKDFMARIFVHPFKNFAQDWLNGLGLGFAGSIGTAHSNLLPQYKTFGQQTFFSYNSTTEADGARYRFTPQFYYYFGPFGMLGELVESIQELNKTNAPRGSSAFRNNAGQLAVSYVVTGENASYTGVTPRNNFDPSKGTWGAFEVTSRFDWLSAEKDNLAQFANLAASAQRAAGWALGFNWYLNKFLKFSTAFEQTFFDDAGITKFGTSRHPKENAFIGRLQIAF
ncbi:MAG TPA: porin [Candidatus Omnitrophota bacterium]|nr:porin [Candidatus Omnitrophota bacterium]HRY85872.1 porin [Candidatus Omnitrophota bacterium]